MPSFIKKLHLLMNCEICPPLLIDTRGNVCSYTRGKPEKHNSFRQKLLMTGLRNRRSAEITNVRSDKSVTSCGTQRTNVMGPHSSLDPSLPSTQGKSHASNLMI